MKSRPLRQTPVSVPTPRNTLSRLRGEPTADLSTGRVAADVPRSDRQLHRLLLQQ